MRTAKRVLGVGLAAYTASWFIWVMKGGVTLADGILPGWEALRVALSPVWPYQDIHLDGWFLRMLSVASALTNLIVLALPLWLRIARRSRTAVAAVPLWLAAAINAHWIYQEPRDLRWGYYLWLVSFIVLAVGVGRFAKALRGPGSSAA